MKGRKTLEINPEHPIVKALKDKVDGDAAGAKVRVHSLAVAPNHLMTAARSWAGIQGLEHTLPSGRHFVFCEQGPRSRR